MTYKVIMKGAPHAHKLPFWCPHCKKQSGTIDDEYFMQLGICAECVVMFVEERKVPVIDLSKYAPRGGLFEGMTREEIDSFFQNR